MICLTFCVACGGSNPEHLHQHHLHHLVPRSCGGTDDETNLITLCVACHGKVHGRNVNINHHELTKIGIAKAKARGTVWGNPKPSRRSAKLGREAVKANARRFAANVRPIIDDIMRGGATSHNAIAAKLNERNVRTARGGISGSHVQVGAILSA